jgi:hypothetical protein
MRMKDLDLNQMRFESGFCVIANTETLTYVMNHQNAFDLFLWFRINLRRDATEYLSLNLTFSLSYYIRPIFQRDEAS